MFRRGEQSLEETIDILAGLPLLFQPGTQWRYSLSTDVLGYLVQVIADQPLDEFLKEHLFKPLGMVDTGFHVPAQKVGRLAQVYASPELYDPKPIAPEQVGLIGDVTTPTRCPSGGGGLVSTLADYLAFSNMLLNRGSYDGTRIISRKTLDWMTANHVPAHLMPIGNGPDKMDHGFGLGFRILTDLGKARSLRSVGEFGWGGAAQTYFWIDPAEEMIGLMMTQHMPVAPYPVQERFRTLAYAAIAD
jgi:CubicO group peptidase (beta-lactamase class C family)